MARDIELEPVLGGIPGGAEFRAEELAGYTNLYSVTPKSGHWAYKRFELRAGLLVLLGEEGIAPTQEAADEWVQRDWIKLRNHLLWINYMSNNPPPNR